MRNILSRSNRRVLEALVWSKVLLAFDYDGTLAPIVRTPEQAHPRSMTRRLLTKLTAAFRVIVISGRAQPDVIDRLDGLGVADVVGNHGIEPWDSTARHAATVRRWRPFLDESLGSLKGVVIEDKVYSVAVHYRLSREKKRARALILDAVTALGDVRVIRGKAVVNILPVDAPHKGIALERARERLRCDTALYVGDDETDEDVFSLDQPGRLLGVRVGWSRTSAASYYVPNQRTVDDLLRVLIDLRGRDRSSRVA